MKPKQLVTMLLGYTHRVSVRRGRGTAQSWLYIHTVTKISQEEREIIEKRLVAEGLCGTYASDQPGIDTRDACVSWNSIEEGHPAP